VEKVDEAKELPSADQPSEPPEPSGIPLGAGTSLTLEQGNALANRSGARLVIPAGPIEVGKTTFLVELYSRFVREMRSDALFIGSETLLDFELLTFPSRLNSKNSLPETWRTRLEDKDNPLLHLAVKPQGIDAVQLLFGNYSGELFEHIADRGGALKEVPLFRRCDRLLIFVDGKRIAIPGRRTSPVSRTRQFIRVLSEEKPLPVNCKIALVLAKLDEVEAAGDEALEAWDREQADLLVHLNETQHEVETFRIAARPIKGPAPSDQFEELFQWLIAEEQLPSPDPPRPPAPTRAFEKFGSE
jgi:hypothetical protein